MGREHQEHLTFLSVTETFSWWKKDALAMNCSNVTSPPITSVVYLIHHRYFFPAIFPFGLVGNALNLFALTRKSMWNRTNQLFAAMAIADVLYFLAWVPIVLDAHDLLIRASGVLQFFMYAHIPAVAWVNWFSAASIWISLVVTAERLFVVRFPLHARVVLTRRRLHYTVACVFLCTFLITVYHYFTRSVYTDIPQCNDLSRPVYRWRRTLMEMYPVINSYVQVSTILFAVVVVTVPLIIIAVLNSFLLYYLRKSKKSRTKMIQMISCKATPVPRRIYVNVSSCGSGLGGDGRKLSINLLKQARNHCTNQTKNQTHTSQTLMVLLIVASYILFNSFSAVLLYWHATHSLSHMPPWWYELSSASNMLVTLGKSLNFVLYCISSRSFRNQFFNACRGQKVKAGYSTNGNHKANNRQMAIDGNDHAMHNSCTLDSIVTTQPEIFF